MWRELAAGVEDMFREIDGLHVSVDVTGLSADFSLAVAVQQKLPTQLVSAPRYWNHNQ